MPRQKTRKCSDEKLKTMLGEAREASKHLRKLGRVTGIVACGSCFFVCVSFCSVHYLLLFSGDHFSSS